MSFVLGCFMSNLFAAGFCGDGVFLFFSESEDKELNLTEEYSGLLHGAHFSR